MSVMPTPTPARSAAARVLAALRVSGPTTANQLMDRADVSRTTVHAVCDELIDAGWVRELRPVRTGGPTKPGRRARQYEFNERAGVVVGVDLGANKVRVAVADLRGEVIANELRAFDDTHVRADRRLAGARLTIASALEQAGVGRRDVLTTTIGVPGPVGRGSGTTVAGADFLPGLAQVDLRTELAQGAAWDVLVENDCNLAAVGEVWQGAAAGVGDVVAVLAGERLGAGIIADGRLVRGGHGGAGELGFLFGVDGVGDADGIGMVAARIARDAVDAGWDPGTSSPVTAEHLTAAATAGDATAVQLIETIGARFARVFALVAIAFDPEVLVVGGAVADAADVLLPAIRRNLPAEFDRLQAHHIATDVQVVASALGSRAVVTGAVRAALDHVDDRYLGQSGRDVRHAPAMSRA